MNIFILDEEPEIAAQMQSDKHVVKMVLETGQMLSTAHHLNKTRMSDIHADLYKPTHANHHCTQWVAATSGNYKWTYRHFRALNAEYKHRFYFDHKTWKQLRLITQTLPASIVRAPMTAFAQAMPDEYKVDDDAVVAYRHYYAVEKRDLLNYRKRPMPQWLEDLINGGVAVPA